jgi:hypothetical protein
VEKHDTIVTRLFAATYDHVLIKDPTIVALKRHFHQLPLDSYCIKNLIEIVKAATTKIKGMVEDLDLRYEPRNILELPWNIKDDSEDRKVCIDL